MSISKDKRVEKNNDEHICGEKCQIYSRCCGYYRPVENWNIGKQEEFKERLLFDVYDPNKDKNRTN